MELILFEDAKDIDRTGSSPQARMNIKTSNPD